MTEIRAGTSAASYRYFRSMLLTPREHERALAELADLRHRRDRLVAALENHDLAYHDDDVVRLNNRINELTCSLGQHERARPVISPRYY